jgi:hypothetical protein
MAGNRYAMDGGQDWFSQNDPGLNTGPMQTQSAIPAASNPAATMPGVYGSQSGALTGGGGPTPGNEQAWFMQLVGNRPWNQQTFNELAPTLQQYGFHITPPNANQEQTKIQLPTGEWVRVGFGEGHPVWIPQGGAGTGGAGATVGAGAGGINSPWPIPAPFQSPSAADLQNEPGYQARYQMGLQGLERGAAAQGSLLSGGTQKALARYGQDYATNEYGNAYNRAYQNYMGNFNVQSQTPWNRYQQVLDRGVTAALGTKTPVPLS